MWGNATVLPLGAKGMSGLLWKIYHFLALNKFLIISYN